MWDQKKVTWIWNLNYKLKPIIFFTHHEKNEEKMACC